MIRARPSSSSSSTSSSTPERIALGTALFLYVGGVALALWRADGRLRVSRLFVAVITAAVVYGLAGIWAPVSLGVVFGGVVIVGVLKKRLARRFSGA